MKTKTFCPEKFRAARIAKGFSYLSLARLLQKSEPKASKQSVWKWETGKATPSYRYLLLLSAVFRKPIDHFFKSS